MSKWRPKPKANIDYQSMKLSGEEGYLLSRLDGSTSVEHLVHMTGMPAGKVQQILDTLVDQGAIERAPVSKRSHPGGDAEDVAATALHEMSPSQMEFLAERTMEEAQIPEDIVEDWQREVKEKERSNVDAFLGEMTADGMEPVQSEQASDQADNSEAEDSEVDASESEEEEAARKAAEEPPLDEETERNYRKLYETVFHPMGDDQRVAAARSESGAKLLALCFDPLPSVVKAIFENMEAAFPHARLVAAHHRTPQGLDAVLGKPEFLRDSQVQRHLLRNVQLQEPQLKKLLAAKRLNQVYRVTIDRDVAERNRQKARNILRSKWSTAGAEERADLVFTTEGRCLMQLTGLSFDSHTVSLLCARSFVSLILVQNLARFSATPPALLAHLMRQPTVKRQPQLRTLILQHPNCPSDVKRKA